MTAEHRRLEENRTGSADWLGWGPYLSERQWGTASAVRKPSLEQTAAAGGSVGVRVSHPELGEWLLCCEESAELLFCENETNNERLFGRPNVADHVKDAFHDYVVGGVTDAVNSARTGTKAAVVKAGAER